MPKNRSATEIVRAYFQNPNAFYLAQFERDFITQTYMPSGKRRLSGEAVAEKFFPGLSTGGVSYKTWAILDKVLDQLTNPVYTKPMFVGTEIGAQIATDLPHIRIHYNGAEKDLTVYTDAKIASAILCFGVPCVDILYYPTGNFTFGFEKSDMVDVIIGCYHKHEIGVSPKALLSNMTYIRSFTSQSRDLYEAMPNM